MPFRSAVQCQRTHPTVLLDTPSRTARSHSPFRDCWQTWADLSGYQARTHPLGSRLSELAASPSPEAAFAALPLFSGVSPELALPSPGKDGCTDSGPGRSCSSRAIHQRLCTASSADGWRSPPPQPMAGSDFSPWSPPVTCSANSPSWATCLAPARPSAWPTRPRGPLTASGSAASCTSIRRWPGAALLPLPAGRRPERPG
jgi:hypothetical protein